MPDSSSSSTSSTSSDSAAEPRNLSLFNRAQLEQLEAAEHIVAQARLEPAKTILAGATIGTPEIDHLANRCLEARRRTARSVLEGFGGEANTVNATGRELALFEAIQRIQAAARQKYARRDFVKLQNYFTGERVNADGATMHQVAFTLSELLSPATGTDLATATDRLPGIGLDKINTLRGLIDLPPIGASSSSSSSSSSDDAPLVSPDMADDRAQRDAIIAEINDRRMEIQFAMDGERPYTNPLNAEIRRLFHLPPNQPYTA